MYSLLKEKRKGKVKRKKELKELKGFMMTSKKGFTVCGCLVKDLEVLNKKLANGVVTKQVLKKYNKLMKKNETMEKYRLKTQKQVKKLNFKKRRQRIFNSISNIFDKSFVAVVTVSSTS